MVATPRRAAIKLCWSLRYHPVRDEGGSWQHLTVDIHQPGRAYRLLQ